MTGFDQDPRAMRDVERTIRGIARREMERLGAEEWMVEAVARNPTGYTSWAPGRSCMAGGGRDWNSPQAFETWADFESHWPLDDANACVSFYFVVSRSTAPCGDCEDGFNPETSRLKARSGGWREITRDEAQALIDRGRVRDRPDCTAADVAADVAAGRLRLDEVDRFALLEARARRLAVWGMCPTCDGRLEVFTDAAARLSLMLWVIHPRHGASRGVRVERLRRQDVDRAARWLRAAARQNAARFAGVSARARISEVAGRAWASLAAAAAALAGHRCGAGPDGLAAERLGAGFPLSCRRGRDHGGRHRAPWRAYSPAEEEAAQAITIASGALLDAIGERLGEPRGRDRGAPHPEVDEAYRGRVMAAWVASLPPADSSVVVEWDP